MPLWEAIKKNVALSPNSNKPIIKLKNGYFIYA